MKEVQTKEMKPKEALVLQYLMPDEHLSVKQRQNLELLVQEILPENDLMASSVDGMALLEVIKTLPQRQQSIISMYYGLDAPMYSKMSMCKVAEHLGISNTRCGDQKEAALRKLNQKSRKTVYHKKYREEAMRRIEDPRNNLPVVLVCDSGLILSELEYMGISSVEQLAVADPEELKAKIRYGDKRTFDELEETVMKAKKFEVTSDVLAATIVQYKVPQNENLTFFAWDTKNLPLSERTSNILCRHKVMSLPKFVALTSEEILKMRNAGQAILDEVREVRSMIGFPMEE